MRTNHIIERPIILRWLIATLAVAPLLVIWALANPILASPDENVHMVHAQGIARGDLTSPFSTDGLPIESIECFRFQPEVTAACQDLTWGTDGTERMVSTGNYPPLFHSLAAIPALALDGLDGAYAMRIWTALICAVLFGATAALLSRPGLGPWPLSAFVIALTPMVIFTAATVNPSGMAAAFAALYVAGAVSTGVNTTRTEPAVARTERMMARVAIATGAIGLALVRRDGLLWLALVTVALVPLLPISAWTARLRAEIQQRGRGDHVPPRRLLAAGAVAFGVLVVAAVWARPTVARFWNNFLDGRGGSPLDALGQMRNYFLQLVGYFGWLDSPITDEMLAVAGIVIAVVLVLAFVTGSGRRRAATAISFALLVVTPIAFGLVRFPYLQGRYLFPIWMATMITAGFTIGPTALRRAPAILLGITAVVQYLAFAQNLRRYTVGASGPWSFMVDYQWRPPTMAPITALVLYAAAIALAAVAVRTLLHTARVGER